MAGPAEADEITSPVVWRRWLSSEFVRLRNKAKLTQRDAAHALRCSVGKLSYLESGDRAFSPDEIEILLSRYKVPKDRWPEYVDAAEAADQEGWWDAWADEDLPKDMLRFIGLEDGARRIRAYQPTIVEGLLQTADYAAAILESAITRTAPEKVDRIAQLRTARLGVLTRSLNPAEAHVVLDEAALRRKVGGPRVWRDQMAHLVRVTVERPNLTLQVVPFSVGAHGAFYGPFRILDFPWKGDPGVVYVEGIAESSFLESREHLYQHSHAFNQLVTLALDTDRSIDLIRLAMEELG